ncbi:hypothetical protein, partial [Enterobacter intestinihominis]
LLEQAFCFSAFSKIVGWRCGFPTFGAVCPGWGAAPGHLLLYFYPFGCHFFFLPHTSLFLTKDAAAHSKRV